MFRIKHGAWVINVDNASIAGAWVGSGGVGGWESFPGEANKKRKKPMCVCVFVCAC